MKDAHRFGSAVLARVEDARDNHLAVKHPVADHIACRPLTNCQNAGPIRLKRRAFGKFSKREHGFFQSFTDFLGGVRIHFDQEIAKARQISLGRLQQANPALQRAASFSLRTRLNSAIASSAGMLIPVR